VLAAGLAAVAMLAACGGDDDTDPPAAAATEAPTATQAPAATEAPAADPAYGGLYGDDDSGSATPATAAAGAASVGTADTALGTILVDGGGMTLYAFTNDTGGQPTCVDGCADAWPPAFVDGEPDVGALDAAVFSVVEHPAGGSQLKAGDFPLYRFAGDQAPGDTNGQGSGGVWFVVAPDGSLIR
jgi:predicted lipoprotein with Yx(FWY)xxD motif